MANQHEASKVWNKRELVKDLGLCVARNGGTDCEAHQNEIQARQSFVFRAYGYTGNTTLKVKRNQPVNMAIRPLIGLKTQSETLVLKPKLRDFSAAYEWNDKDFYGGFRTFVDGPEQDRVSGASVPSIRNPFVVGMRVEAIDRKCPSLIAVATIAAISGDNVQIYFDGWSHHYDYWCRYDSPEICAGGTGKRVGLRLYPPSTHDDRHSIWRQAGNNLHRYVSAIGATLAPIEAFGSLVRPESSEDVLSLQELCLRQLVSGLREDVLEKLGSGDDIVLPHLPSSVRRQLRQARCCGWCGKAFLTGYKCVEAFTAQFWLSDPEICRGRTSTTCSKTCGEAIVYRDRQTDSNGDYFLHPRLYVVPPHR